MDMARSRNVVRLGVPALIVAALAVAALWRVGAPATDATAIAPSANVRPAALEGVRVVTVTSPRTFWMEAQGERAFVVLDPDVVRAPEVGIEPGARLTLVGLVRPAPPPDQAMRQWGIDADTAHALEELGTYLHCTEVRAWR
jgi:hypothetical protein